MLDAGPIYDEALRQWGIDAQLEMMEEECAELILAIQHFKRGRVNWNKVAEEVADVTIMSEQIRRYIRDHENGVDVTGIWRVNKLARLKDRLDGSRTDASMEGITRK